MTTTTTTTNQTENEKRVERLRAFLFDNNNNKNEETIEMNKENVFTKALDGVKKGWSKFKENKTVQAVVDTTGKYLGKAYRYIKKNIFNLTAATASTIAAGALTNGAAGAISLGALFYAGVKSIEYLTRHLAFKQNIHAKSDALSVHLKDFAFGLAVGAATALFLWFAGPYLLSAGAWLLNASLELWAYSLYFIFA